MPNYRRGDKPGATRFFTVYLLERHDNDLLVREIQLLRRYVASEHARRPFAILAWVVLPEHMHRLWRLPEGDADFATRWRRIRTHFIRGLPKKERRSAVRIARGERGILQRQYWEHQIRDESGLQRRMDYIHYNPVKHGWVKGLPDWPHSSFAHHVTRGVYPADWAEAPTIQIGDD